MIYRILRKECKSTLRTTLVIAIILVMGLVHNIAFCQTVEWKAPIDANTYNNPYKGDEKATREGKKLYAQFCAICHGNKGKGDGVAGMALKPRPSNFTKGIVQGQSDGALFWKMTEGKAPMASYKETLTKEQRWQLVNFIRSLQ